MGSQFEKLNDKHINFILHQNIFFVGTAGYDGFVNISPKGMDTFKVIDNENIIWLNLTGSGNETASHILENNRMTIMFCSFDKTPTILRLYGDACVIHHKNNLWSDYISFFPNYSGSRQIFKLNIKLVLKSCGYGVPYYDFKGHRDTLIKWSDSKGDGGIKKYWQEKNRQNLNGKPTGISE